VRQLTPETAHRACRSVLERQVRHRASRAAPVAVTWMAPTDGGLLKREGALARLNLRGKSGRPMQSRGGPCAGQRWSWRGRPLRKPPSASSSEPSGTACGKPRKTLDGQLRPSKVNSLGRSSRAPVRQSRRPRHFSQSPPGSF
jgi:hypothetical protein